MLALAAFVASRLINMTSNDAYLFQDPSRLLFAHFYTTTSTFSISALRPFEKASRHFNDVLFAQIDCRHQSALCEMHRIIGLPTLLLFTNNRSRPYIFTSERTADDMISFITHHTNKTGTTVNPVVALNSQTFSAFISGSRCNLVLAYVSWCRRSRKFLKDFRKAPHIVAGDPGIRFGMIDCELDATICPDTIRHVLPHVIAYRSGQEVMSKHPLLFSDLIEMVNTACSTYRNPDGSYRPEAVIWESRVNHIYAERLTTYRNNGFHIERIKADSERVEAMIRKDGFSTTTRDGLLMRSVVLKEILRGTQSSNTTQFEFREVQL
jgi:hypothetical protein